MPWPLPIAFARRLWTLLPGFLILAPAAAADTALPSDRLQRVLERTVDGSRITGTTVCLRHGGQEWCGAAGDLATDRPFHIASTTKLYTTALVLQLADQSLLGLDDTLADLLPDSLWTGLHTLKGQDRSATITVRHLLGQTSGLPDYFMGKPAKGPSLEEDLLEGHDQAWSPAQALERSRALTPGFPPGKAGKALYSDTNYQLLGLVIEQVTGQGYAQVLKERILDPLALHHTWLAGQQPPDGLPSVAPLRSGKQTLEIPRAMASFGPDGGIIATAGDLQVFLQAFFQGRLFAAERLPELQHWNRIFFPLEYGTGLMRFRVPRLFSPFKRFPALIGHSGLSGAFAFYCPERDLYLAGTVNQIRNPGRSFQLMLKLIQTLDSAPGKTL
jgi:D-alanyl-D-alanine carboxypeptidase